MRFTLISASQSTKSWISLRLFVFNVILSKPKQSYSQNSEDYYHVHNPVGGKLEDSYRYYVMSWFL